MNHNIPKYQLTDMRTKDLQYERSYQEFYRLTIQTEARSFENITSCLENWLESITAQNGLLTLFLKHTSASLTIQENTDRDVQLDILDALDTAAPKSENWRHSLEGSDDLPAHIKSSLFGVSQSIPVFNGAMELGTWQAVYLVEHREQSHMRTICLHYAGETKRNLGPTKFPVYQLHKCK